MATKKAGGSSRNGRDSAGRRLGLKVGAGQTIVPGTIIVRQRGTKMYAGLNVGMGKDHTLFAVAEGKVEFQRKAKDRLYVNVKAQVEEVIAVKTVKAVKAPKKAS